MKFSFVITNLAGGGAERVLLTLSSRILRQRGDVEIILLENRVEHDVSVGITSRDMICKRFFIVSMAEEILGVYRKITDTSELLEIRQ